MHLKVRKNRIWKAARRWVRKIMWRRVWRWEKEDEAREKSYAGERQGLRKARGHSASTHTVESLKSSRVRTVLHEQLQKHIHIVHLIRPHDNHLRSGIIPLTRRTRGCRTGPQSDSLQEAEPERKAGSESHTPCSKTHCLKSTLSLFPMSSNNNSGAHVYWLSTLRKWPHVNASEVNLSI